MTVTDTTPDDIFGKNTNERTQIDLPDNPAQTVAWSTTTPRGRDVHVGQQLKGVAVFYETILQRDVKTKQIKWQPEFFRDGRPNPKFLTKDGKPNPMTTQIVYVLGRLNTVDRDGNVIPATETGLYRDYLQGSQRFEFNQAKIGIPEFGATEKAQVFSEVIGMTYDRTLTSTKPADDGGGIAYIFTNVLGAPVASDHPHYETVKAAVIGAHMKIKNHQAEVAALFAAAADGNNGGDLSALIGAQHAEAQHAAGVPDDMPF